MQNTTKIERDILFSGAVVSVKVPLDAHEGTFPSPDDGHPVPYLQFARNVEGGLVNLFVHGENPNQFRGTRIIADAHLIRKTLPDKRAFLHVNLYPVSNTTVPTHRLLVMTKALDVKRTPEGSVSFTALGGLIVFALIVDGKAKIVTAQSQVAPATRSQIVELQKTLCRAAA
jgi:hypothetical protein